MSKLMFRCRRSGEEFDSGFRASLSDLNTPPADASVRLRCRICGELHEFNFADATFEGRTGTEQGDAC
jgi:hypothetical protein